MDSGITWHKSSYSGGESNCVEVGAAWHKSTHSLGESNCVEVAENFPDVVYVRDTKTRDRLTLSFGSAAWAGFLTEVKAGRYDTA